MRIRFELLLPCLLVACSSEDPDGARSAEARPASAPVAGLGAGPSAGGPPAVSADANGVAATVDGEDIPLAEVDARVREMVSQQMGGMALPEEQMAQIGAGLRSGVLEQLIDERLFARDVEQAGLSVTDEELAEELERNVSQYLFQSDLSREDFGKLVQDSMSLSLDEYLTKETQNPALREAVLQMKRLGESYPERCAVSDEEVETHYGDNLAERYERPAMVRASHILVGGAESGGPADPEEARQRARELAEQAAQPGADFAALAREHSTGPSAPVGGDLGFFAREGAMVEPFAAAAFDLGVGEVSGVVETEFGFHVITVTEKREARTVPLEEAAPLIRHELEVRKTAELREDHIASLREAAEIRYPGAQAD